MSRALAPIALALVLGSALPSAGQAPVSFDPAVAFATGTNPAGVAIGDVNGDGTPDLVTANTGADTISILLGTGSGSFGLKTDIPVLALPHGLALAHLNGDGHLDIVVATTGADQASVLLGNGTGSFTTSSFVTGAAPFDVAIGDLNGDGIPDFAVVNVDADTVSVLIGNGGGGFGAKTDFVTGLGARADAIGDLNGDGLPDLVVANVSASAVSVLLGNGTGSFGPKNDLATGAGARDVATADVNGDGRLDVIVANANANSVSVLLGAEDGNLGSKVDFTAGGGPRSVVVGDVNQDGKPDLVVANFGVNTISVLLGTGDGTFGTKTDFATGAGPFSVDISDLNGDGKPDLAVADVNGHTVSVFLNSTANRTPTADSLTPSAATAGGPGFTLTLAGSGFVAASVVSWNGGNRSTTFVSSTEVRAAISAGDIAAAGTAQVAVFSPAPGGGTSAAQTFTISTQTLSLTVTIAGSSSDIVTSSPAGINCPTTCSATFPTNSVVVTAIPGPARVFTAWGAGCSGASKTCRVTLSPTSSVTASFSTFTDATITAGSTVIKALHIMELRSHINALRLRFGTPAFPLAAIVWTDQSLGGVKAKAVHIQQLRTALQEAYDAAIAAGRNVTRPSFTADPLTPQQTVIREIHIDELRAAVVTLEAVP